MIGAEQLQELSSRLRCATPEHPEVEYFCQIRLDGVSVPCRIMCHTIWSPEESPEYVGVIGKLMEE